MQQFSKVWTDKHGTNVTKLVNGCPSARNFVRSEHVHSWLGFLNSNFQFSVNSQLIEIALYEWPKWREAMQWNCFWQLCHCENKCNSKRKLVECSIVGKQGVGIVQNMTLHVECDKMRKQHVSSRSQHMLQWQSQWWTLFHEEAAHVMQWQVSENKWTSIQLYFSNLCRIIVLVALAVKTSLLWTCWSFWATSFWCWVLPLCLSICTMWLQPLEVLKLCFCLGAALWKQSSAWLAILANCLLPSKGPKLFHPKILKTQCFLAWITLSTKSLAATIHWSLIVCFPFPYSINVVKFACINLPSNCSQMENCSCFMHVDSHGKATTRWNGKWQAWTSELSMLDLSSLFGDHEAPMHWPSFDPPMVRHGSKFFAAFFWLLLSLWGKRFPCVWVEVEEYRIEFLVDKKLPNFHNKCQTSEWNFNCAKLAH